MQNRAVTGSGVVGRDGITHGKKSQLLHTLTHLHILSVSIENGFRLSYGKRRGVVRVFRGVCYGVSVCNNGISKPRRGPHTRFPDESNNQATNDVL